MKGIISFRDKRLCFTNWGSLTIQADDKFWVYDGSNEKELRFKLGPMGGRAPMSGDAELGEYFKRWRKGWGFTQAEAGREFGISQSMVAKIEKGTRPMSVEVFQRIRQDKQYFSEGE
jgi:DNA-binding XRE family transcriptional regulator